MRLHAKAYALPKAGQSQHDCEDASGYDLETGRFVVADGASHAFEAGLWARALVHTFLKEPPAPDRESLARWLLRPTRLWNEEIDWPRLPWYGREKARRGSFSTLLGLALTPRDPDTVTEDSSSFVWDALALGDSCLFQIRDESVITSFPVGLDGCFCVDPPLLSTRPDYNAHSLADVRVGHGEFLLGDLLVLTTDAMAAWFLRQVSGGGRPWSTLMQLSQQDEFVSLVSDLRRDGAMADDDVTLLLVWLGSGARRAMPSLRMWRDA